MNQTEHKTLSTLDGNTLMAQEFPPLRFAVDKILPHGLFILAGSPKIGKSWLSLDLCQAVATGGKLWDFTATEGDVLYLALEDNYSRLQNRLRQMEAERMDMHDCIIIKEKISREALRKYGEDTVNAVGATWKQKDTFGYEVYADKLQLGSNGGL